MTNENIVKRLREWAEAASKDNRPKLAGDLNEAADEIEYLRQRCEEIDQERKQRETELGPL